MAKQWKDLSQSEKIEDLRKDVERIFATLNELVAQQRTLAARQRGMATQLSEVAKAVEALERGQSPKKRRAR